MSCTLLKVAGDLSLKINEVHDAVAQHPGVVLAASEAWFLVTSEEDVIVNWIHDVTDLGWGVKASQISSKIKSFLTSESFIILFGDDLPINEPSVTWISGEI